MIRISRTYAHRGLLLIAFAFTAWMELGLRRHLYHVLGHTSIIAGSIANFVAVWLVAMLYINLPARGAPTSPLKAAVMATLVMSLYELAQPWIPGRVFDVNDLVASLLGGLFAYLVLTVTDRLCAPEPPALAEENLP